MDWSSTTGDQRTNSISSLIISAVKRENSSDALSFSSITISEGFSLNGRIASIFNFLSTFSNFDLFVFFFIVTLPAIIVPKTMLMNFVDRLFISKMNDTNMAQTTFQSLQLRFFLLDLFNVICGRIYTNKC